MEHHHEHAGHADASPAHDTGRHAGHHTADFLRKFWIAFALAVPIFAYSDMARMLFGFSALQFPDAGILLFVFGSIAFFYCGAVFLTGAARDLSTRRPGMMTLIALAMTASYLYSAASLLLGTGHDLWFELVSLIAIMLLGHWIEMRSVARARGALAELAALVPDTADVERDGALARVPVAQLRVGDIVRVVPGARVPADGEVESGASELDESILTGESRPVAKAAGAEVIAGSINGDGTLRVRVTRIGESTFLSGIMRLVAQAQESKSRLELLSDTAATWLTFIAVGTGALTFAAWFSLGEGLGTAIERTVAVLVVACPHALGLAIPLVAAISTSLAARSGFLVRERRALEAARTVDTVLFDKTGTLTQGTFSASASSDEALALAVAVEAHSEHAIARAVLAEATRRGVSVVSATGFRRVPGVGAEATVDGRHVFVGHRGGADIVVEADGAAVGTITVADSVRPESREAIQLLAQQGVRAVMVTGDSENIARTVAEELGITEYFARVLPGEKAALVERLQKKGRVVAMVGDGVNDAPALAAADVGIAIGAGTNVAIESAGIILVRNDPRDVSKVIALSHLAYAKMLQNLFWATGYNIVAIPLAAGAFTAYGVVLQPAVAAILMSASTVIVAGNAVLLRRSRL